MKQDKDGKRLKRQIRYLLRTGGGRLDLVKSHPGLLMAIGRFMERVKFKNSEEAARALGMKPHQLYHASVSYRKLLQTRKATAPKKKLKLARVKIVDEPVKNHRSSMEMVFEGGVRVSVDSADAAIDLLDRLEQRRKLKAVA